MSKKVSPRLFVADKNPEGLHFFAAANSKDGFVSFFDKIFGDKIERLYILIGGPGCGKSTALKKIAAKSEEKGFKTEYIHCSSSPESLDGVIISDKKIAVIDGTSPHTYTPKIPGARETYVDLGAAWNKEKLYFRKSEIEELCRIKSSRYKRAYIYIAAANILKKQSEELVTEHILSEKLSKIAQRSYEKLSLASRKGEKNCEIRIQRAVSGVGNLYFDSFCNMAKKTVFLDDFYGTAFVFIEKLRELAEKNGNSVIVSYDPEDVSKPDGIYFKECQTSFTVFAKESESTVNCSRFFDKSRIRNIKEKYTFLQKTYNSLMTEAYDALAEAHKLHDQIEEIYKNSTDFSVTEKISENLLSEIFGE